MASEKYLTPEQIKNGWFSCGMNIDSFNAPVADKFGDVEAFARKIELYTEEWVRKEYDNPAYKAEVKTEPASSGLRVDGQPKKKPGRKTDAERAARTSGVTND